MSLNRRALQSSFPLRRTQRGGADANRLGTSCWMLALAGVLLCALPIAGYAERVSVPASHKKSAASPHANSTHPRRAAEKIDANATAIPPAPPAPVPPIHQAAQPATVKFSQGKLRIDANNSSLNGILQQISRETGLAVDGMKNDKRIYGQYGPGPVSSTLSQLLDGAGYNYVIVDGAPGHPPTKLLLTLGGGATGSSSGNPSTPTSNTTAANPAPASGTASPSTPVEPKTVQQIFDELRRLHPPK